MEAQALEVEYLPTDTLVEYAGNAKVHTREQVGQIVKSIEEFGFNDPIAVWTNKDGKPEIVEGHGRLMAARQLGMEELPVIFLDRMTDEQRRAYTHVHNQLTMNTGWDVQKLEGDIEQLDFDWEGYGFDIDLAVGQADAARSEDEHRGALSERFGIPPFSVLNARSGEWQERKRQWLSLGIKSELGRGGGLDRWQVGGGSGRLAAPAQQGKRLTYNIDARASAYRG